MDSYDGVITCPHCNKTFDVKDDKLKSTNNDDLNDEITVDTEKISDATKEAERRAQKTLRKRIEREKQREKLGDEKFKEIQRYEKAKQRGNVDENGNIIKKVAMTKAERQKKYREKLKKGKGDMTHDDIQNNDE